MKAVKLATSLLEQLEHHHITPQPEDILDALWLVSLNIPATARPNPPEIEKLPPELETPSETPQVNQPDDLPEGKDKPNTQDTKTGHSQEPTTSTTEYPQDDRDGDKHAQVVPKNPQGNDGLAFRVSRAQVIRNPRALTKALKPFKRSVPSQQFRQLNEAATVDFIAQTNIWLPITEAAPERWLSLALVVDTSPSMIVWKQLIREFQQLLTRQGIFRAVTTWGLELNEKKKGKDAFSLMHYRSRQQVDSKTLIDATGRQLIIVISDGHNPAWQGQDISHFLALWGNKNLVSLLHVFPESLWNRTAFDVLMPKTRVTAFGQDKRNRDLISIHTQQKAQKHFFLPTFTLNEDFVKAWAQMVASDGGANSFAFALRTSKPHISPALLERIRAMSLPTSETKTPQQEVAYFRERNSRSAYELAGYLAAAPLQLPIMQLVQQVMMPENSSHLHLAEILTSNLLKPETQTFDFDTVPSFYDADTDAICFDFKDGVREYLLEDTLLPDMIEVLTEVSRYILQHYGKGFDFRAFLQKPTQENLEDLVNESESYKHFAEITAAALRRMGGQYTTFAHLLEIEATGGHIDNSPDEYIDNSPEKEALKRIRDAKKTGATSLDLSALSLTSVPSEIKDLKNLTQLNLSHNSLTELPSEITQLSNLLHLDLSYNRFAVVPLGIISLESLKMLELSFNRLSTLPSEIQRFQNLEGFNLSANQISVLPKEIIALRHLNIEFTLPSSKNGLNLAKSESTLRHPPVEIVHQGWDAIDSYFQQSSLNMQEDRFYETKLVFIGEGRAGKTSLMRALQGKPFDAQESSTEGIEIASVKLPKRETGFPKDVHLNMWDFGGQEIYKDTHRFFLTSSAIYILVTENRKNINYNDIYYWLNVLNIFAPNAPVLLVQNKCEKNIEDLPFQQYKRDFKNIVPWSDLLRTSCIVGYEDSITRLRQTIIEVLQDEQLVPKVGHDIPIKWIDIRTELAEMKENGRATLSYQEFTELCMGSHGFKDPLSIKTLASYFFRIGVFTHYEDNLILSDTIFLDHEWLTKGVYRIIDSQIVKDKKGEFTTKDLKKLYKGTIYEGLEAQFAELMHEFKICYRVDRNKYLCPLRLPVEEPNALNWAEWQQAENLHYAFKYPFMPRGILTTFIVDMHQYATKEVWKRGVILRSNKVEALIFEDLGAKRIHIYAQGKGKRDFLAIIVSKLQGIHQELNDLPNEEEIACHCNQCIKNPANVYFFKAKRVIRYWEKGMKHILCDYSDEEVSVAKLVGYLTNQPSEKVIVNAGHTIIRDNDSYNFYGQAQGHIGGARNTYSESRVDQGIHNNILNSSISGNITINNQVHNQQVDIDIEILKAELNKLTTVLAQQMAKTPTDTDVSSALMAVMQAKQELSNDNQQDALEILKNNSAFRTYVQQTGLELLASLIQKG